MLGLRTLSDDCASLACKTFDRLLCLFHTHTFFRSAHLDDTGWVSIVGQRDSYFRFLNVTLSCTGNITHFVAEPSQKLSAGQLAAAVAAPLLAVLLVVVAGVGLAARRGLIGAAQRFKPDYQVAAHKGYRLRQLLSQGKFGKVYRGTFQ